MGDLKEHQSPMTIDEQVENLKSIGLLVDNIELLFDKYDNVQIKIMGFPNNWKELLENK